MSHLTFKPKDDIVVLYAYKPNILHLKINKEKKSSGMKANFSMFNCDKLPAD